MRTLSHLLVLKKIRFPHSDLHADRLPQVHLTNKPFLKQIFAGVFDTDMLTYPEMETDTEFEELERFVKPYEELFSSASAINFTANEEVRSSYAETTDICGWGK